MQAAADKAAEEAAAEAELERVRSERALDHLAEIWLDMETTDAWVQLAQKLREHEAATKKRRFADYLAGEPVNQREIDYDRGLFAGLKYPFDIMDGARGRLAKRDRKVAEPEQEEEVDHWS